MLSQRRAEILAILDWFCGEFELPKIPIIFHESDFDVPGVGSCAGVYEQENRCNVIGCSEKTKEHIHIDLTHLQCCDDSEPFQEIFLEELSHYLQKHLPGGFIFDESKEADARRNAKECYALHKNHPLWKVGDSR